MSKNLRAALNDYFQPVILYKKQHYSEWDRSVERDLLGGYRWGSHEIYVGRFADYNACTTPDGLIVMDQTLLKDLTYPEQVAVLAHEYAHYLLCHTYVSTLRRIKKRNRNKVWAEIGTGFIAFSDGLTNANNENYNKKYGTNYQKIERDYGALARNFFAEMEFSSEKHSFMYSQEQEMQADFVAYRFLEWVGVGGKTMISALRKIRNHSGYQAYSQWSDHPTLDFRMATLNYVWNKEHTGVIK